MPMTLEIARAAAMDAADRQMHKNGRTRWNEADYNLASTRFCELRDLCPGFEGLACHGSPLLVNR
jgi:hypothetical protein